jgi:hypothetical protein
MNKYALLIGINYYNTSNRLYGCINDVIMMRKHLIEKRGYNSDNIIILRDDSPIFKLPNKENIINELTDLIKKANDNNANEIFFHYSGHGTWIRDRNGDESDKRDEMICPVDLNMIVDDQLRKIVSQLNNITNMFIVMDSCFSGTNIDLPYLFTQKNGKLVILQNNSSKYKELINKNIHSISGCRDDQTAADAYNVYQTLDDPDYNFTIKSTNRAGGALTSMLLKVLDNSNFINILPNLQKLLAKNRFNQVPQLSSTKNLIPAKPKRKVQTKPKKILIKIIRKRR